MIKGGGNRRKAAAGRRTCVMVLGMHRSGTSSLTRMLNLLGLHLSEPLLPPNEANTAGFWELEEFVALNERILAHLNTPWYLYRPLPERWLETLPADVEVLAAGMIERHFATTSAFALKDPRACRTWPFWKRVLERVGIRVLFAHVLRSPAEVSASLQERDGLAADYCAAMWIRYVLDAESAPAPKLLIAYDSLIGNARDSIRQVSEFLSLNGVDIDASASAEISAFLRPSLRHHAALPVLSGELGSLSERVYGELTSHCPTTATGDAVLSPELRQETERGLDSPIVEMGLLQAELREMARIRALTDQHVRNLEAELLHAAERERTKEAALGQANAALTHTHATLAERHATFVQQEAKFAQQESKFAQQESKFAQAEAALAHISNQLESADEHTRSLDQQKAKDDETIGYLVARSKEIDIQVRDAQARAISLASELEARTAERNSSEAQLAETRAQLDHLSQLGVLTNQHVRNLDAGLADARSRIAKLDEQATELAAQAQRDREAIDRLLARTLAADAQIAELSIGLDSARNRAEKAETERVATHVELEASRRMAEAARAELEARNSSALARLADARGLIDQLRISETGARSRIGQLGDEVARTARTLGQLSSDHATLSGRLKDTEARHSNLLHVKALTDNHVSNLAALLAGARQELDAMSRSRSWRITGPMRAAGTLARRTLNRLGLRSPQVTLVPESGLRAIGANQYQATDNDPHFSLNVPAYELRGWSKGWYSVRLVGVQSEDSLSPKIYVDYGDGYSEQTALLLPADALTGKASYIRMQRRASSLRIDPVDHVAQFRIDNVRLRRVPAFVVAFSFVAPLIRRVVSNPRMMGRKARGLFRLWRTGGIVAISQRLQQIDAGERDYKYWVERYDSFEPRTLEAFRAANRNLPSRPRISIVTPVYNPPEVWLRRCIESVREQTYPEWELCLADDASTQSHVARVIAEYAAADPRIRAVRRERNGHIAAASNSALELATGQYVALLDHDDELAPTALYWMAKKIGERPDAVILYSDEDKIDDKGMRSEPYFKPDWNPELVCAQNYVCHLGVYRRDAVSAAGGFREGFEGSQDWDLLLRVAAACRPDQIHHIPRVLYHWRAIAGSTALAAGEKSYAADAGLRAVTDYLVATGVDAEVAKTLEGYHRISYALPEPLPLVSIIIPTRNGRDLVATCIESLKQHTLYDNYEILLVDNQSDDPVALAYFAKLAELPNVRVLRYDAQFNFSAINNFAVAQARGSILLLLNNDIEIIEPDWLTELVRHAVRPETGVVGAKLLYPNRLIQHAGIIVGFGGVAGHIAIREPRDFAGQMSRCKVTQNLTAVTAACLAVRKSVYVEAGALDSESLRVAFNDVDFCLKVAALGYRNVWTPHAELIHHESVSRGYEDTPEKQARFAQEVAFMRKKWGDTLLNDPAYNPNLDLERRPFGLSDPPRISYLPGS